VTSPLAVFEAAIWVKSITAYELAHVTMLLVTDCAPYPVQYSVPIGKNRWYTLAFIFPAENMSANHWGSL